MSYHYNLQVSVETPPETEQPSRHDEFFQPLHAETRVMAQDEAEAILRFLDKQNRDSKIAATISEYSGHREVVTEFMQGFDEKIATPGSDLVRKTSPCRLEAVWRASNTHSNHFGTLWIPVSKDVKFRNFEGKVK